MIGAEAARAQDDDGGAWRGFGSRGTPARHKLFQPPRDKPPSWPDPEKAAPRERSASPLASLNSNWGSAE